MSATILAIDLGTQSLRVTVLDLEGRRLWSWQRPVATMSDGERQEQDAGQWRALLMAGLREASAAGIVPDAILASGPLAGFVPLDAAGEPLASASMYNDTRSEPDLAEVEAALPPGLVVPRPTIADPLPHALRLRRESPAIFATTAQLLDATGWLNFALTGAATLNAYSALRLYDAGIRAALGSEAIPFGRRVEVGEVIAPLSSLLATRLGWPAVPVIAATFDSKCAYLGSGIGRPGEALDISGTVTSFGVVSASRIVDPENRIYSIPFGDGWLVRGSTAAAGSVLEWARELFGLDIAQIDALALDAPIGADDPIFVPYLSGARAPLWRPRARGSLTGLSIADGRAAVARAIYAGLALSLRHIVDTIEACGTPIESIRLAGGLSRSAALAQIKADILGRPVTVMAESELTTLGMAAIGATALGAFDDIRSAGRSFATAGTTHQPRLPRREADAVFARYLRGAGLSVSHVPKRSGPTTKDDQQSVA